MNDNVISKLINEEKRRQIVGLELIASENYVSNDTLEAQGSILTNKYAEGYPNARYYAGCNVIDKGHLQRFPYQEIDVNVVGTGDMFTAIIAAQISQGKSLKCAIEIASQYISSVLFDADILKQKELRAHNIMKYSNLINQ